MTGENSAPAEMPGVEEIAELLVSAHASLATPQNTARAVLALFAPILAEKERTALRRETRALSQAQEWRNIAEKSEARALAAEAAILAVSPYVDSVVCYASTIDTHDGNRIAKLVSEAAAAIRAQE